MAKRSSKSRLIRKRGKKVGAAPGTLVHIGESHSEKISLRLVRYDKDSFSDQRVGKADECIPVKDNRQVSWLTVEGVHEAAVVQVIGDNFGLHPLVMEDILNTDHRPKIENHESYLYIVIKTLSFDEEQAETRIEQVSLILGKDYLLSFMERKSDLFDGARNRLSAGTRIRQLGADHLAYTLIDAIVDNYYLLLEKFGDQIETLEEELLGNPSPATLARIHHFKREMLLLRKVVSPLREVLGGLSRDDSPLISPDAQTFLRDVYDHTIHIMDTIDTLRDLLAGMLDLYVSSVSNRMNEIMKVLTIFTSIFMPLTFIAGVYGMNFQYMPELSVPWAYPAVMAMMLCIGIGLAVLFRWKKWL